MGSVKVPARRQQQAAETRERIRDAAAEVFREQGFTGTRVEDIAARAGVAIPTVYKVFTNKVNLLIAATQHAMAGDDASIERQAWFTEQLDEPDPARQLQLVARNARHMYERAGQLLSVMRAASPLHAPLAQAWEEINAERRNRSRRTAQNIHSKAARRLRLARQDTATTLYALTEPELFTTFTATGRSADRYEAWLGDLLVRALLT